MNLEIRPGLSIEIHTSPGSNRIRWNLPDSPPCMFDPTNGSWHPYHGHDPKGILANIPAADLVLIEIRLQRHSAESLRLVDSLDESPA